MKKTILLATLICGTLDIAYAIIMAVLHDGNALGVLLSVASGPFGSMAKTWGWTGGMLGLATHFSIMLVMVTAFVLLIKYIPNLARINSIVLGIIYGCLLYTFMYWIVLILRWPEIFPQTQPMQIIRALAPHIFMVGIPLSLIVNFLIINKKSSAQIR